MLYEERVARFQWNVPEEFNFAWDVIDAWAEEIEPGMMRY